MKLYLKAFQSLLVVISIGVVLFCFTSRSYAFSITPHKEFPIGVYIDTPTSTDYEKLRSLGVNLVFIGGFPITITADEVLAKLNEVNKYGMKAIVYVGDVMWPDNENMKANLPDYIGKIKNHPALYGYYLCDEPELYDEPKTKQYNWGEFVSATEIKELNAVIKAADPQNPTIMVFSSLFDQENTQQYTGIADIEGFDLYPFWDDANVTNSSLSQYSNLLPRFVNFYSSNPNSNTKSLFVLVQAFKGNGLREPTETELTNFINTTFAASSMYQGILYYTWRSSSTDGSQDLGKLASLQSTVSHINNQFLQKTAIYPVKYIWGDLNNDFIVNATDLSILIGNYLTTGVLPADLNLNGKVDVYDYLVFLKNYGKTIPDGNVFALQKGFLSQTLTTPNHEVRVKCDYGQALNCIGAKSDGLTCAYTSSEGTAAVFTCTTSQTPGSYPVSCTTAANTSDNCSNSNTQFQTMTIEDSGGTNYTLNTSTSTISPTTVSVGGQVMMSCDFGKAIDCVNAKSAGFENNICSYDHTEGTKAIFTCTAIATPGRYPVYCYTNDVTEAHCSRTQNPLNQELTIQ